MGLLLQGIEKIVGREYHLKDIHLELDPGAPNVLLGRTLAGKTTLLRLMAGLDRPTRGKVLVDGKDVTGISVRKRSVAMVYQQFINYPSFTVYNNIASPLRVAGLKKADIDRRVLGIAEMLHIEDLMDRLPAELSGGQQQRTAIARALVKETQLLLMDEPLVNLDYKLREELRIELQGIFSQRRAIVVYATTEPTEALMLGGHIAVIDEGRILQTGPTPEVYRNPATLKVAEVFSDPPINYLKGIVHDNTAQLGDGIQIPLKGHMRTLQKGEYIFGVRSNHLFLNRADKEDAEIRAKVAANGPAAKYSLRKYMEWLRKYAPPGALGMHFYTYLPVLAKGHVAQQIFWYTAFTSAMVAPGPTVNADGTPKWRMAPSPHGPYWEEGMKLGYQDAGSWTLMKSTPLKRRKAAWLYAQFTVAKTTSLKKTHVGLTPIRDSDIRHESFTERAPKLGGLVEFYSSPARVAWTPTGTNVPDYPKLAQLWWQNVGEAVSGEVTVSRAMDNLAREQDRVLQRIQRANVQGECGPN